MQVLVMQYGMLLVMLMYEQTCTQTLLLHADKTLTRWFSVRIRIHNIIAVCEHGGLQLGRRVVRQIEKC